MKNICNYIVMWVVFMIAIVSCERPQSPNFKLEQKIQGPFAQENTYQFMGNKDAIIDTTAQDYITGKTTFTDIIGADLSYLPGEGDNQQTTSAVMTLYYTNGVPVELDFSILMLDKNGEIISELNDISVEAAAINSSGYVAQNGEQVGKAVVSFSRDELRDLNLTRTIEQIITFKTPQQQTLKLRGDEFVTIRITLDMNITSTIN
jgi:hypothetical protein